MLPQQKLPLNQKGDKWREECVRYFENLSYTNYSGNRATNYRKLINYDLYNGRFNKADLAYVCEPMGITTENRQFPAQLQHYDIISPAINTLIGEEMSRPDNSIVIAENKDVINRKKDTAKKKILAHLQELLMAEIDPSTVDPNNPPKFEELEKYANYNFQDLVESQASKILKHLKRKLNTRILLNRGWKDALIAGEEIFWTGLVNGEPVTRRVNPVNVNVILANDSEYVDDALAVVEVRLMSVPQIIDEFGDDLKPNDIKKLEDQAKDPQNRFPMNKNFSLGPDGVDNTSNYPLFASQVIQNNQNSMSLRVVRVEWIGMEKIGVYKFKDENDQEQEQVVSEIFKLTPDDLTVGNTVEWFWINQGWEGTKIGLDMFINIKPKVNQRRRLDNPYYTRLGYQGLIYNSTNSISVSLVDRLKPYQYLYNIIAYRLELAFASDMGKIMLMDLAQIPRSEGIDVEQWMYYLKAMKIGFINSFEEGKGKFTGQKSTFNQFQSIDMSLTNVIQQYINTLNYIKQQIFYLSGVDLTRLGQSTPDQAVGTNQMNLQQSANVTRCWVEGHNAVKERVYTALLECAKIAYREGLEAQYVMDDLTVDMLSIEGSDIENAEFGVFVSNSARDQASLEAMKQLFQTALQADKANLSDIAKVLTSDSMSDLTRMLEKNEAATAQRGQEAAKAQQDHEKEITVMQLDEKQKDRDLKEFEVTENNRTKIEVAEIGTYFQAPGTDADANGVPDILEIAKHDLEVQKFQEEKLRSQLDHTKEKDQHSKEISLKEKELTQHKTLEEKKLAAEKHRTNTDKQIADKDAKLKEKELKAKIAIEKIKARNKPKSK
jgi:hypothetical protein